ncbi:hypothetical protein RB195_024143 [Necator americanus]|uniref:Uncharacterized protein n=1 Tax=Necator americanus TaxID=51031 RepID=A0ABR1EM53_NECAM
MLNEIPPTCVYSCWSTDQKEVLRCGLLHKVHPECGKKDVSVLLTRKKFAYADAESVYETGEELFLGTSTIEVLVELASSSTRVWQRTSTLSNNLRPESDVCG